MIENKKRETYGRGEYVYRRRRIRRSRFRASSPQISHPFLLLGFVVSESTTFTPNFPDSVCLHKPAIPPSNIYLRQCPKQTFFFALLFLFSILSCNNEFWMIFIALHVSNVDYVMKYVWMIFFFGLILNIIFWISKKTHLFCCLIIIIIFTIFFNIFSLIFLMPCF